MGRLVCKDLELFLTKLPAQSPFQLERTWQFHKGPFVLLDLM